MSKMILTKQYKDSENLEFNLYHGTSNLFIEKIREKGFSYRDENLFDKELLEALFEALKKYPESELMRSSDWIVERMINKDLPPGSKPFHYGGTFFSISFDNALGYARGNGLGAKMFSSEFLTTIFQLYDELKEFDKHKALSLMPDIHPCKVLYEKVKKGEHRPVVITLINPSKSHFFSLNEAGKYSPIENRLAWIYKKAFEFHSSWHQLKKEPDRIELDELETTVFSSEEFVLKDSVPFEKFKTKIEHFELLKF